MTQKSLVLACVFWATIIVIMCWSVVKIALDLWRGRT